MVYKMFFLLYFGDRRKLNPKRREQKNKARQIFRKNEHFLPRDMHTSFFAKYLTIFAKKDRVCIRGEEMFVFR